MLDMSRDHFVRMDGGEDVLPRSRYEVLDDLNHRHFFGFLTASLFFYVSISSP